MPGCCAQAFSGVVSRHLTAVASLAVEHGLRSTQDSAVLAQGHSSCSSYRSPALEHRLNSWSACGIFSDQGPNPCLPHWQVDSSPLNHQRSPLFFLALPCVLCGILLPQSGIKPMPPTVEPQSPNHQTARESGLMFFKKSCPGLSRQFHHMRTQ